MIVPTFALTMQHGTLNIGNIGELKGASDLKAAIINSIEDCDISAEQSQRLRQPCQYSEGGGCSFLASTHICAKSFPVPKGKHPPDAACEKECARFQTVDKHECLHLAATINAATKGISKPEAKTSLACMRRKKKKLSLFTQLFIRQVVAAKAAGNKKQMQQLWGKFCPKHVKTVLGIEPDACSKSPSRRTHVLMLGDSISRFMVEAVCAENKQKMREWSGRKFYYGYAADGICKPSAKNTPATAEHKSIAFLHFFGSKAVGPYIGSWKNGNGALTINRRKDHYVDTRKRVVEGIKAYREKEGTPTMVALNFLVSSFLVQLLIQLHSFADLQRLLLKLEFQPPDVGYCLGCEESCSQLELRLLP
jgi:hypothetical protein